MLAVYSKNILASKSCFKKRLLYSLRYNQISSFAIIDQARFLSSFQLDVVAFTNVADEVTIMIPDKMMLMDAALTAAALAADMSSRMTMRPAVGGRIGVFFLMYETRIQKAHLKLKLSYLLFLLNNFLPKRSLSRKPVFLCSMRFSGIILYPSPPFTMKLLMATSYSADSSTYINT